MSTHKLDLEDDMTGRTSTHGGLLVALTVLGTVGCDNPSTAVGTPSVGDALLLPASTVITAMRGAGAIGSGDPTFGGVDRQSFVLDVGTSAGVPYGQFDYIDSGFVKEDGNYPHFVVGSEYSGTAITNFAQTSDACAAFDGVGRLLNTGELLAFHAETCDNGQPGVGLDSFGIYVPQRLLTHSTIYRAGPFLLSRGELTASGTTTASCTTIISATSCE